MAKIELPYGQKTINCNIPDDRLKGVLTSQIHDYTPEHSPVEIVQKALNSPIGTPKLSVMAEGKKNVVILCSDHTRPVPSKTIIPLMLEEIRKGNPDADITLLIATGCHRITNTKELKGKFGEEIIKNEKIVVHDCDNSEFVYLGRLPSGGIFNMNKLAVDADLLCSEGFIEPHVFAGYSGGRKSVFPGIACRKTVMYNHNAGFVDHPNARCGVLEDNPIHLDMLYAARVTGLDFICNVVINSEKDAIYAVAGDVDKAHLEGCKFLASKCMINRPLEDADLADIVITTNGGYPLDQNIYQAVKGMLSAMEMVKEGGVIIMAARSEDGHGGDMFYEAFKNIKDEKGIQDLLDKIVSTPKEETVIDQWQSQMFIRLLQRNKVIYVSEAPDDMVKDMHMTPAKTIEEAVKLAEEYLQNKNATITVIPDGVSVIVG